MTDSHAAIDALPDELLLRIMSHVRDGHTMLDGVPLVCHRWLALSREPEAWSGVDVNWDHGPAGRRENGRVLLRAPAVRRLTLTSSWDDDVVAGVMRRSRTVVREELQIGAAVWKVVPDGSVLDLLVRSSRHVRVLKFRLSDDAPRQRDRGGRCPLGVLALMRRVRHLRLSLDVTYWREEHYPYAGQLAGALPRLYSLAVECGKHWTFPDALLADVVRGAARSLHVLEWASPGGVPVAALEGAALRELLVAHRVRDQDASADFLAGLWQLLRDTGAGRELQRLGVEYQHAVDATDARRQWWQDECYRYFEIFLTYMPDLDVAFTEEW